MCARLPIGLASPTTTGHTGWRMAPSVPRRRTLRHDLVVRWPGRVARIWPTGRLGGRPKWRDPEAAIILARPTDDHLAPTSSSPKLFAGLFTSRRPAAIRGDYGRRRATGIRSFRCPHVRSPSASVAASPGRLGLALGPDGAGARCSGRPDGLGALASPAGGRAKSGGRLRKVAAIREQFCALNCA